MQFVKTKFSAAALAAALVLSLTGCAQDVSGVFPGTMAEGDGSFPTWTGAEAAARYREAADILRAQGITDVDGEAVQAFLADAEAQETVDWAPEDTLGCACMLLDTIGWGDYDYDTGAWSSTSSQVYAFDAEVYDLEHMYTLFLNGAAPLLGGEAAFTDISEDDSAADWDSGTGIRTVRFTCGGREYTYDARIDNDWFDTGFFDCVGRALTRSGCEKSLLYMFDGGQGYIFFYNTEPWARDFERAVGAQLTTAGGKGIFPA